MARKRRSLLGDKGSTLTAIPASTRAAGPPKAPRKTASKAASEPEKPDAPDGVGEDEDEGFSEQPTVAYEDGGSLDADPPAELHADPGALDDLEDSQETEVIETRPRNMGDPVVLEDDDPLIGEDLSVPPPDEDDDEPMPQREVLGHLHAAPPDADPDAEPGEPPTDDDLVLFDEKPDQAAGLPDQFDIEDDDDIPETPAELLDPESALHAATPPMPVREEAPAASLEDELPGMADDALAERDFFGEEDGDPPTEEHPPGMQVEDFANLYRAPMDVPDAPVMPGILGGETPPPVAGHPRKSYQPVAPPGSAVAPTMPKPTGMWDETPLPRTGRESEGDSTPPPPVFRDRPPAPPEDVPFYQDTWFMVAAAMAALAAIAVLLLVAFLGPGMGGGSSSGTPGTVGGPGAPDLSRPPVDLVPTEDLGTVEPDENPDEVEDPDTSGRRTTTPAVTPTRQPGTDRAEVNRGGSNDAGETGRLKIRASKQTLIYVNGKPVGLTPLDLDRPAGAYEISGEVDGQRRVERVDLSAGTIRLVDF